MIIISKKRILAICGMVIMAIFAFVLQTSNINKNTLQTTMLPISNKVIVLNAKHPRYLLIR